MPPWEHSIHQEFYLEEQLIDTYVTYQDWLENGFIEPPKEFSKSSRMDECPIGNDETISWDRYEYHTYLIMEYDRRGIKFDDNDYPIELAKEEGANKLFIKDMEYRKTITPIKRDIK
jgi:hypothetical protein